MKKNLTLLLLLTCFILSAQKKKNGSIYIDHPEIQVIENLFEAMNANDSEKLGELIADNYKGIVGDQMNKDAKPQTKDQFIQYVNNLHTNSKYFSVKNTKSSYPDAVEYKDENFSGVTWIYSWEYWTAVGGTTGIDYSQPRHSQYVINKENKISYARYYFNQVPYTETGKSQREISDGKIYSHHSNINTVRRFIKAFEHDDDENIFIDFDENATADGLFNDWGNDPLSLDDLKEGFKSFKGNYKINSMDNVWIKFFDVDSGSDYVQSWWRVSVERKNDKKEIVFPVMFNHRFNDDGKIIGHWESWNEAKLN